MIRKLKYIIPAVMLLAACNKQLDINVDPNNPATLPESKLLTYSEKSLGESLTASTGLTQILSTYTHQTVVREDPDQYGAIGTDVDGPWENFYISTVTNLNLIIANGTVDGNLQYVGIAEILKAYGFSQFVDTFGDIPYSQAGQLITNVRNPVFDKDATIYPELIALLDKGIADVSNKSAINKLVPAGDDVIYQGSIANWIKAANVIKLKLYLQQRLITNVTSEVTALIKSDNLFTQTSDSFMLPFGINGATDDRNPGYSEYFATQRSYYTSPWFYEILKGYNPWIYTGFADPRIPYYFFNQLGPDDASDAGHTEYRDGGFVSIYFGDVGPYAAASNQDSYTVQGIYPVGGRYDDGKPQIAATGSGTGAAPYKFITYADQLYMEAELMQTGVYPGVASDELRAAINESFKQVDYIVGLVGSAQTVPPLSGTAAVTTYVNKVMAEYAGYTGTKIGTITLTAADQQLASIMTQKWIASFGSSVDQYTDYRRTSYPVLFDPNNTAMAPNHKVQPPVNGDATLGGSSQAAVPVELTRQYPLSLPWSQAEINANGAAPAQKLPASSPVFWYKAGTIPTM
jgi:hypothetical protein